MVYILALSAEGCGNYANSYNVKTIKFVFAASVLLMSKTGWLGSGVIFLPMNYCLKSVSIRKTQLNVLV